MRLRLDADRCQGHGRCYSLQPDLFEADEEGHGTALIVDIPDELRQAAMRAAAECPERAITTGDE